MLILEWNPRVRILRPRRLSFQVYNFFSKKEKKDATKIS